MILFIIVSILVLAFLWELVKASHEWSKVKYKR